MTELNLSHSGRLRVLIVEDEARLRDMLVRAVTDMDFGATGVASAEAALRHFADQAVEIAILDLNLPGMSGMQLFSRVRKQHPQTQVIVLTGFGDLDAAKAAIHLDAVDFLTKPCALGDLEVSLDRARARLAKTTVVVQSPEQPAPAADPTNADNSMEMVERNHILAVLEKNHGNRAATAAELGISLRKLYYRLEQYQQQGLMR
jgi:DNA-binding NtrC family response regulator